MSQTCCSWPPFASTSCRKPPRLLHLCQPFSHRLEWGLQRGHRRITCSLNTLDRQPFVVWRHNQRLAAVEFSDSLLASTWPVSIARTMPIPLASLHSLVLQLAAAIRFATNKEFMIL